MMIPLEDGFHDILGKAMRGLGIQAAALASKAAVGRADVQRVLDGVFDEKIVRRVAVVLGLDADRLVDLAVGRYVPAEIPAIDGLEQYNTPFDDMAVNAYLVWDPATKNAAAFDTGSDVSGMLARLLAGGLKLAAVYITHAHGDHIFDLDRLVAKGGAREIWGPADEPIPGVRGFDEGREFQIGALRVKTLKTWGHSRGGITYFITGLARPVAVVGDAMFAGSMGGGGVSYGAALETNRSKILTLPDETILCPGHGPLTTVGEQKRVNPFFPGLGKP